MIFKTKINVLQWLALVVTYLGLFVAFRGEMRIQGDMHNFIKGTLLIFVCAITYALYIVGSGRLIPSLGAAKFNSYAMSFASLAVLIHFFSTSENSLFAQSSVTYVYSLAMAILSTVIPSYLVTEGIKRIGSGNAAIVGSIGPISTILQAYLFLQEPIHFLQLLGTAFILFGVLLIGYRKAY